MALSPRDCSLSYTSQNALQFTTQCGTNLQCANGGACILANQTGIRSLTDCMEFCSFSRPRCYSVTYTGGICVTRDNTAVTTKASSSADSAIVNSSQLATPTDLSCPYSNLASVSVGDAAFEVFCNKDLNGNDLVLWNQPQWPHAATMSDCMQYCIDAHPLCKGIAWNPDMVDGYHNCYLKTTYDGPLDLPAQGRVDHSARITNSFSATSDSTANYTNFKISPGDLRNGATNYSASHETTLSSCVGLCGDGCVGVILDNDLTRGWKNRYLLNSTGTANFGANVTYAEKISGGASSGVGSSVSSTMGTSSTGQATSGASPDGSGSGGSTSKAWIAGPVIGGLLLLVAIFLGFWLMKRRRKRGVELDGTRHGELPAYTDIQQKSAAKYEAPINVQRSELESDRGVVPELEGSRAK